MRRGSKLGRALLLGVAVAAIVGASVLYGDCDTYYNSRLAWIQGVHVCAYNGSGCTECYDYEGNSCVTNGSSCTPIPDHRGL